MVKKVHPPMVTRKQSNADKKSIRQEPDSDATPKLPAIERLEAELAKIRNVGGPLVPRERLHEFWKGVLRLRKKIKSSKELQDAIKEKHSSDFPRTSKNFIGVIIQSTAPEHVTPQLRYKYITMLDYALLKKVKSANLIEFIQRNGGLNGCCALFNKQLAKKSLRKIEKNPD